MNKISVVVPTYNEENRIKYCLQCLKWCDEVYVIDKSSTDKTVEIAEEMGAIVMVVPHEYGYDPHELDYIVKIETDWIVSFTCSDLIDKSLAMKVRETIMEDKTDVILVAFKQYVLGINDRKSPWFQTCRRLAFRKSVMEINTTSVHAALKINSKNQVFLKGYGYMYHLTHATVDGMMDRHIRYWRGEAECYNSFPLRVPLNEIFNSIKRLLRKRSFFGGWDIFALACAFLAYYLMSFVYIWEKKRNKASQVYKEIREEVIKQWE